jgi:putative heme-binding domain-containing protein
VALFRASATGRSRMPYIGTRIIDDAGITLLREWIENLGSHSNDLAQVRAAISRGETDLNALAAPAMLSTSEALRLAHAADHPSISIERREKLARAVLKSTNPLVRELFERFLPPDERAPVSQAIPSRQEILSLKGDAKRGAALLADSARISCLQCHQYKDGGRNFGPPFKQAVQNKSRTDLLDNILEPSRQIAPEYVLYAADLGEDDQLSGMIVTKNGQEVVLRDAGSIEHRIPVAQIKSLRAQQLSAMPEGLLAGLTAQDVADLLDALLAEGR